MLKKIANSILGMFLALLLLTGGTAKEFLHLFTGHQDTVHCTHAQDGLSFEDQHHHCTFLSFTLAAFDNDINFPVVLPVVLTEHSTQYHLFNYQLVQRAVVRTSLRGPPAPLLS